ncbi:sulfurtransferase complex subunit TusB [Psychromonas sp. Urea-02u-13]|uniref:sulfurtransferase complex subunit TusB n=1 Tax=Psychromonas sp. Urea-02u-13 TaxID=2058326 RepID=UPI000C320217|nr:sulfurtransferase complex subunit TusB [Psychromonas sp. Urea-02u-13]PKG40530.1 sulfurtransferase complex subunit TusB [Psychromonas sp. Urea-02u-13]
MSILHTVNTSPFQTHALQQCLSLLNSEDCLLLIEDAVVAAQAQHPLFKELSELAEQGRLKVLTSDLQARGIENRIGNQCAYADFVTLVTEHTSQMAW